MIYVLTVHWRSSEWIEPQLDYLRRHIASPYQVFAVLNDIDDRDLWKRFDHAEDRAGPHGKKLNFLAELVSDGAEPDDVIVFLDSDAFPIRPLDAWLERTLASHQLVAVQRKENLGDLRPHPSFCATTVETWNRIGGDWSRAAWTTPGGDLFEDAGALVLEALETAGVPWYPLTRSNTHDLHPLWFGVYGGIVYHHGAGFRWAVGRVDLVNPPRLTTRARHVPGLGRLLRRRNRARAQRFHARTAAVAQRLSDEVYGRIERDPEFYRELI